ncbi:hypothetical protein BGX28_004488 [Mortierella sp. GBA30]|nr:hypothetical protein BGX28_004488 [Mortierella sp. GBA30]
MNILQHKSWHVYSQKNRDKVRRDEAKAEEEQRQTQERAIAADREHRLALLRQRAQKRQSNIIGDETSDGDQARNSADQGPPSAEDTKALVKLHDSSVKRQHVNFWSELEQQDTKSKQGNPEREAEEKLKQEKWDRKIAMHLDAGIKGSKPWYTSLHAGSMNAPKHRYGEASCISAVRANLIIPNSSLLSINLHVNRGGEKEFTKVREDPLSNMKVMLDKRDKARRNRSKSPTSSSRQRSSRRDTKVTEPKEMSTMAKLRKERMERELAEQAKTRSLLDPEYLDPAVHHQPVGAYSQQFNPQATNMAHSSHHRSARDYQSGGGSRMCDDAHDKDRDRDRSKGRENHLGKHRDQARDRKERDLRRHRGDGHYRPY